MKVFVTGVCGQLGHDVLNELVRRGIDAVGSDIQPAYAGTDDGSSVVRSPYVQLDITDRGAVFSALQSVRPDAVIHCSAWTAVDAAEAPENRKTVFAVNADGARNVADAANAVDAKILYISTDYVFDGCGTVYVFGYPGSPAETYCNDPAHSNCVFVPED